MKLDQYSKQRPENCKPDQAIPAQPKRRREGDNNINQGGKSQPQRKQIIPTDG
jgi:hypothetical protein